MRILAFSDWRTQDVKDAIALAKREPEPVDVIVYAGDDLTRFRAAGRNYFSELAALSRAGVLLAVAGNDDFFEQKVILAEGAVLDLYERPFVYGETGFLGVEGSTSGPGNLQHPESTIKRRLAAFRKRLKAKRIVVVSHPPPYGILDEGIRFARLDEGHHHIGSKGLRSFVLADPGVKLVICGHCHSHGGLSVRLGKALVVNVASHDGEGSPGKMAIMNLDEPGTPIRWLSTQDLVPPDSLLNLHSIGRRREQALRRAGVRTISELSNSEGLLAAAQASGMSVNLLKRLQLKARSYVDKRIIEIAPFCLKLERPLFFDIETDIGASRVWLVGVLWDGDFRRFYSDSWAREEAMLKQFLDFLAHNRPGVLISYSCTSFDRRVLANALRRYKLDGSHFGNVPHTDLGAELARCLALPIKSRKVKDVGRFFGYQFKHGDLDGLHVAHEYSRHLEEARPLNPAVLDYNEDDVRVLDHIVRRVSQLSGSLDHTTRSQDSLVTSGLPTS
jgi:Icc-related predicted phosphoesterase